MAHQSFEFQSHEAARILFMKDRFWLRRPAFDAQRAEHRREAERASRG